MDAYFSGDITKGDMLAMKRRYDDRSAALQARLQAAAQAQRDGQMQRLRAAIQSAVAALLRLDIESEVLCKTVLDRLTVFPDRHMELRLHDLPQVFCFTG